VSFFLHGSLSGRIKMNAPTANLKFAFLGESYNKHKSRKLPELGCADQQELLAIGGWPWACVRVATHGTVEVTGMLLVAVGGLPTVRGRKDRHFAGLARRRTGWKLNSFGRREKTGAPRAWPSTEPVVEVEIEPVPRDNQ
jgi:hypothetical protein